MSSGRRSLHGRFISLEIIFITDKYFTYLYYNFLVTIKIINHFLNYKLFLQYFFIK